MDIPPVPPVHEPRGSTLSLTSSQAQERLATFGHNDLPTARRPQLLRRVVRNLLNYFAILLWVAAALSFIARLPELSIAIIVVIVLNAVFAFVQEGRAERAAEALRDLLPHQAKVFRDGALVELDARDLVPDDIVFIEAGDRIPVDGLVVATERISVDVSMLTGESDPAHLTKGAEVFSGTFAVEGTGTIRATHTGARTRIAEISELATTGHRPATPLERELQRVVRIIAVIAISIGMVFLIVTLLLGDPLNDAVVFGVGVTVALVPEAMLPTVTLTLAIGAQRMAHNNVLIRDLEAVETLGSVTYICTDKTGTLTQNRMSVQGTWTPNGDDSRLFRSALLASTASEQHPGEPMEVAIDVAARARGMSFESVHAATPIRTVHAFDPTLRRMSAESVDAVFVKGAPDSVLPMCAAADGASEQVQAWASKGLRLLAVASGPSEDQLSLDGLFAFEDPPRSGVREAIAECRTSGMYVAMLTGDHPETARVIADEIGLRDVHSPVFVGDELPEDPVALGALLDQPGVVISRVTPEQKLHIANALRHRGHIVAMTGDGVNDAPALHAANVGVAMGQAGTDVAREAADIVLLDNNFLSIVSGIELGRATYVNVRRFLTYHLTDNVAELTPFVVWALSGSTIPLALGVLQILAIDIGTDTWAATALGAERSRHSVKDTKPVRGHILDRNVFRRVFAVLGPGTAVLSMLAFFATFIAVGWRPGDAFPTGLALTAASGAAYFSVVTAQAANAYSCRSESRWAGALGWFTNRYLLPATLASLGFALAILLIPAFAEVFTQSTPLLIGWCIAVVAPVAMFGIDAIDKALRFRRH